MGDIQQIGTLIHVRYAIVLLLAAVTQVSHSLCIVAPGRCLQRVVLSTIGPRAPFSTVLGNPLESRRHEGQSVKLKLDMHTEKLTLSLWAASR